MDLTIYIEFIRAEILVVFAVRSSTNVKLFLHYSIVNLFSSKVPSFFNQRSYFINKTGTILLAALVLKGYECTSHTVCLDIQSRNSNQNSILDVAEIKNWEQFTKIKI